MKKLAVVIIILSCFQFAAGLSLAADQYDRPEIFVQLGHSGVNSVVFSADGKFVLSGGDKTIKIWDALNGREIYTIYGAHDGFVSSVIYSPDERYILSAGTEGKIILWNTASREKVREFTGHNKGVFRAVFSPDGRAILSAGMDGTIRIWDVEDGEQTRLLKGHLAAVRTVAYVSDGKELLSGSWDKTIRLWDVSNARELRSFTGHTAPVNALSVSPDGKRFLSAGGKDGTVRYWELSSGRELAVFRGHTGEVTSVSFSPDGKFAVSGSYDRSVKVWDLAAGKELKSIPAGEVSIFSVAISPDGRSVLAGSRNISLWELETGKELLKLDGKVNWVSKVAVSSDGKKMLSGNFDGTVTLWDSSNGKRIKELKETKGVVAALAFSPDGKTMLDSRLNGPLTLREVETGKELFHSDGQGGAAFSPDGRLIISGDSGNRIIIWDAASRQIVKRFAAHSDKILSVAFSPDGRFILSGGKDKTVRLFDADSGSELRVIRSFRYQVNSVAFSPDGRLILAGSGDNTARLFDSASGRQLNLWHGISISSVAFSPDGRSILISGFDGIPKIIDIDSGKTVRTLKGHKLNVYSAVYSTDGRHIISGSGDGTVRLWDSLSGNEISQYIDFINGEWIVITPEGYYNSSMRGHEQLNIRRGNSVYGIDQFYDLFYRPDIVATKLQGEDISRLVSITVEEAIKNPPPMANFTVIPVSGKQTKAKLCFQVKSSGGGIGEVRLFQNGKLIRSDGFYREVSSQMQSRPIKMAMIDSRAIREEQRALSVKEKGLSGAVLLKSKGDLFEECVELEPVPGENEITLAAFNAANTVQSQMTTISFRSDLKPEEPHLYVFAVGIDRYADPSINLKYAAKDARDFIAQLSLKAETIYKPANIHLTTLLDKQANKHQLIAALEKLSSQVRPGDTFIFFVASHGLLLQNQYYIVTSGFDGGLVPVNELISSNEIVEISKKLKALSQLFIFDTCHAGGVDNVISGLYDARMSVLAKKMGLYIYASAGSLQTALDGYKGNGLYTHTLLEGIRNGRELDSKHTGKITVNLLGQYSQMRTTEISTMLGHPQTPAIISFGKEITLFEIL